MKNVGVLMAVAATAIVVLAVGIVSFLPGNRNEAGAGAATAVPEVAVATVALDTSAMQAAFAAREELLQTQIRELDRELSDRQADYDTRAKELSALIATGESELAQLSQRESGLEAQIDQLQMAQAERQALYAGQRQQAQDQYQTSLQQLQLQLDEANAKLAETLAQLGQ